MDLLSSGAAVGLDLGSTYSKGVLINIQGQILAYDFVATGWNVLKAANALLEKLAPPPQKPVLAATGYGRLKVINADLVLTEISAHAMGAHLLDPHVETVIDIGGQDTKVIKVINGKAREFLMNDKCAAGTGRFLEMALHRLELTLTDLDLMAEDVPQASITSVCAVFAESEMMGLLSEGRPRGEIAKGVAATLADKTAALAARLSPMDLKASTVLTGGLAQSRLMASGLSRALGREVRNLDMGFYAGALGAAWAGLREAPK
jgi:predicted CoA-substrate-specific enzyme activase